MKTVITLDSCICLPVGGIYMGLNSDSIISIGMPVTCFNKTLDEFIPILTSFGGEGKGFAHVFRASGCPVSVDYVDLSTCDSYLRNLYATCCVAFMSEYVDGDKEITENIYVYISPESNDKLKLIIR